MSEATGDEFEDALEDLYGAGVYDSSGSFSLSAEKAQERLGHHVLLEPHDYVLHLFSAGYMAGAQAFAARLGVFRSELSFSGVRECPASLQDCFDFLLATPRTQQEWILHELGLGCHLAGAAGVKRLVVYWGKSGFVFAGGRKPESLSGSGREGLHIVLDHTLSLGKFGRYFWGRHRPEADSLHNHVTPDVLDAEVTSGPRSWSWRVKECPWSNPPTQALAVAKIEEGWIALGEGETLGSATGSFIHLCVRGRRFLLPMKFGKGQVRGELRADILALDLSQSGLVQNEQVNGLRLRVLETVSRLRQEMLLEKPSLLSKTDRNTLVRQVSRDWRNRNRLREAQSLLQSVPYQRSKIACLLTLRGEIAEATSLLREDLDEERFPAGLKPGRMLDLATLLALSGDASAFSVWEKAHELFLAQHGQRKSHLVAESLESKLLWAMDLGLETSEAYRLWQEAAELKKPLGARHPRQAATWERGALVFFHQGKFEESVQAAQRAETILAEHHGRSNPIVGSALALEALSLWRLGEDASKPARQRRELFAKVYGGEHPETIAAESLEALIAGNQMRLQDSRQRLSELGVGSRQAVIVCFRGWFHTRAQWYCPYPLSINP